MLTFKDGSTGRGIYKTQYFQYAAYGHDGDTYGIHSTVQSFLEDKLSIAYSINGEVYPHHEIMLAVFRIWHEATFAIPSFRNFVVQKNILHEYTGRYFNTETGVTVTITRNKMTLIAEQSGTDLKMRLYALNKQKFQIPQKQIDIEFDAAQRQFVLTQDGSTIVFEKIK